MGVQACECSNVWTFKRVNVQACERLSGAWERYRLGGRGAHGQANGECVHGWLGGGCVGLGVWGLV
jgi:hypothetical protein